MENFGPENERNVHFHKQNGELFATDAFIS
jgi:hypothetical protein